MSKQNSGLDLFSEDFDAYHAIIEYQPDAIINLDLTVLPLDSLHKVRYLLPEGDPDRLESRTIFADEEEEENAEVSCFRPSSSSLQQKPKAKAAQFHLPFESMAARFKEGPLLTLRQNLNSIISVKVRRRQNVFSWCTGRLVGFDKHFDVLLTNGEETYSIKEEVLVSARRKTLKDRLVRFFLDFGNAKDEADAAQQAEMAMVRYGTEESRIWPQLHLAFGIRQQVAALEKSRNVDELLRKWAGNEFELLRRLEAIDKKQPPPTALTIAEWVRLPSETYPGHFFYRNNRTGDVTWEVPVGILFRKVFVDVPRKRTFKQRLIRGDKVIVVAKRM